MHLSFLIWRLRGPISDDRETQEPIGNCQEALGPIHDDSQDHGTCLRMRTGKFRDLLKKIEKIKDQSVMTGILYGSLNDTEKAHKLIGNNLEA